MALRISGVRFASDQIASDRIAIDFRYPGPLMIENSIFGEQAQRAPKIRLTAFGAAFATIQGNLFAAYNSFQEDPLELAGSGAWEVAWINNAFVGSTGSVMRRDGASRTTSGGFGLRVATPGTSQSQCVPDQWAADGQFLYVCVAPNTWKRAPLGGW